MILEQYYLQCLSHASYLVGDPTSGQAIVVDPRRDVDDYLADAARAGVQIVGVINTHFHADFVAGHLELAAATGAWIGLGRRAEADFEFTALAHGDRISLGEAELEVLETPGHTWESISLVVREHPGAQPHAVLTGDSLFIGDVGRPDLVAAEGSRPADLAGAMFHTVHDVLLALPDDTLVMPAHGAGSSCGKNLSSEMVSTIGAQRIGNPSVQPMSEHEFVVMVTTGQPAAPSYFTEDVALNRSRHQLMASDTSLPALGPDTVRAELAAGVTVIDSRAPEDFAAAHLRGSYNVGLDGRFAETAGMVADTHARIMIVADPDREQETRLRLSRVGVDDVAGYLPDPAAAFAGWLADLVTTARRVLVAELEAARTSGAIILDVRNPIEIEYGAIRGSVRIPLAELRRRHTELPIDRPVVVHCASGWRSSVAASLLRARGHSDVCDVIGGYAEWTQQYQPAIA